MKKIILLAVCCVMAGHILGAGPGGASVRVAKYKGDRVGAISYTFDDGYSEHYSLAAPELEKRGFRGTFWINGFRINDNDNITDTTWMRWSDLKEMSDNGHEISNHTWSHPNLIRKTSEEVKVEIQKNDTALYKATGVFPRTFCYPYNSSNEEVLAIASVDRVGTRTKQTSLGSKATPQNLDARINRIIESGTWDVAMTHGIWYGYDAFRDPGIFWDHLDKVKAVEDKVWVGTFKEVAAYVAERDNTELDVVDNGKSLIITPNSSLNKDIFDESLTMVIEKKGLKKAKVKQGDKKIAVKMSQDKAVFDFDPFGGHIEVSYK